MADSLGPSIVAMNGTHESIQDMNEKNLSRRAALVSGSLPGRHFPNEFGPEVKIFDSAFAASALLPDLGDIARCVLQRFRDELLQYSPSQGQPYMREWIARFMDEEGCKLSARQIMVTNGAKHALDLVCRLLLDEGDLVAVTAPTYFTMLPIFRNHGARFVDVRQDDQGIVVADLAESFERLKQSGQRLPKMVYDIPDFHNPTGVTTTLERRRELVRLCCAEGVFIVEDSPYRRIRFSGEHVPSYKALDFDDTVIQVGTMSKLIAPGLRLGWVAAHETLLARMIGLKAEGGTSPFLQRLVFEFCSSPAFIEHQNKVAQTYREKRDRMVAALKREIPAATVRVPQGGYCVWVEFPEHVDGDRLAADASAASVNIFQGSLFFTGASSLFGGAPRRNFIRLAYSFAMPEEIDEGVRRLGVLYKKTFDEGARSWQN